MKISLVLLIILLLEGLWEAKAITGEVGNPIEVKCSHTYADTNVKYFCKDPCYDKDVLITSKTISNEKYTIREEGNTFYVTIHDLKLEDSGTYWCGIERVGVDTYNKVLLTVIQGEETHGDIWMSQGSKTLFFTGAGLSVVVLVLAIAVLLFFTFRKKDVRTPSGKDTIATIQEKGRPCGTTTPSNEGQERRLSPASQDLLETNISLEPQIQSDDLCYSSISFKPVSCNSARSHIESTTYSSLKCKAPPLIKSELRSGFNLK
uniref:Immunoglobulin domain-containing protein n=1 Tax=Nothobranchius pienaari TaxID=704102 RepID=A0A1A8LZN8_9TELE